MPTLPRGAPEESTVAIWLGLHAETAEAVDRQLAPVVEAAFAGLEGVTGLKTVATRDGVLARVTVRGASAEVARRRVADHLAHARDRLPEGVWPTLLPDAEPDGAPLVVLLTGDVPLDALRVMGESHVHATLAAVPGVAAVQVCGGREAEVVIAVDEDRARALNLDAAAVAGALSGNMQAAGGALAGGSRGADDPLAFLGELVVAPPRGGGPVRLSDVAEVRLDLAAPPCLAWEGAREAVAVLVQERPGQDATEVAAHVEREVRQLASTLPHGVSLRVLGRDATEHVLRHRLDLSGTAELLAPRILEAVRRDVADARQVALVAGAERLTLPGHPAHGAELLTVVPAAAAEASQDAVVASLARTPGVVLRSAGAEASGLTTGVLRIAGPDEASRRAVAFQAASIAAQHGQVVNARVCEPPSVPGFELRLDREQLARARVSAQEVQEAVAMHTSGSTVGRVTTGRSEVPVRMVVRGRNRDDAALQDVRLRTSSGNVVPLSQLVRIEATAGPALVRRVDGLRYTPVEMTLRGTPAESERVARELMDRLELPPGVVVTWDEGIEWP